MKKPQVSRVLQAWAVATVAWILHSGPCLQAATTHLPRSTPERQGVSSAALLSAIDTLDSVEQVHSLMIVRHGHVVAEGWWGPYDAETPHELYSLSKSFTSTAVGLAVGEGLLRVEDPVLKHLGSEGPEKPSGNLQAMRVRDLLTMSTGHQDEPTIAPGQLSARSFLAQPVPHKPGTHLNTIRRPPSCSRPWSRR